MSLSGEQWLARFAEQLGVAEPTSDEVEALLALAGTAAHASERRAAPIACWLSARAGVDPTRARELAALVPADDDGATAGHEGAGGAAKDQGRPAR